MASKPSKHLPTTMQSLSCKLSNTLLRLNKILSSPTGIDKSLLTIYYTLLLLSAQIPRIRSIHLQSRIYKLLRSLFLPLSLLTGQTTFITLLQPDKFDHGLSEIRASFSSVCSMVSDYRMISRLWGLLPLYAWGKEAWERNAEVDIVEWGQILSCAFYQGLENLAFLSSKGVLRGAWFGDARRQAKWWRWSCRFWMIYVGLEAVKLLREKQVMEVEEKGVVVSDDKGEKERKSSIMKRKREWNRAWYTNAAYAPMTVHWSMEKGILNNEIIGALGVVVAYFQFGHLWKQSAQTV